MELERREGLDTSTAYQKLGFEPDPREYSIVSEVFETMGIPDRIKLISNNPSKIRFLEESGVTIVERVEPKLHLTKVAEKYLSEKTKALGHIPYKNVVIIDDK